MSPDTFFKKIIVYSFHILLFTTPLLWTAKTSELFEFPKMLFVYLMTAIIATAWVSRMVIQNRLIFQKTFLDLPLMLFLASQVISTLFSIDPHTSFYGYYSRFNGGLLSTLAYITLYYAFVSNFNRDDEVDKFSFFSRTRQNAWQSSQDSKKLQFKSFEKKKISVDESAQSLLPFSFLKTTLIGAIAASLYAFPEHFGASPSCQIIGAGWRADCWVQDVVTRVFGTFGQPNWLAAYLITLLFIPLASIVPLLTQPKKSKSSLQSLAVQILTFTLFFAVLLFTKSRSGILGFGVGLIIFFIAVIYQALKSKNWIASVKPIAITFTLIIGIYALWGKGSVPQIDALFSQPSAPTPSAAPTTPVPVIGTVLDTGGTESGDIRKIVWSGAIDIFRSRPLFGTGVETFGYSYYNFRPTAHNLTSEWDFLYNKAHNEFLNHLANSGLFGLGSYLVIMLVFIAFLTKHIVSGVENKFATSARTREHLEHQLSKSTRSQAQSLADEQISVTNTASTTLIFSAFLAGYLALAISNFFGFSTVPVSLLFFMLPAFTVALTHPAKPSKEPAVQLSSTKSFAIFIVIIIGCFLSYRVYQMYAADRAYAEGKNANDQNEIQTALTQLEKAIKLFPSEATYKDEFSQAATNASLYFYEQKQATAAARVADLAIAASNQALDQNKVHLNFYKTQARLLANLGAYEPQLLDAAINTLKKSIELSPTDAKLYFSLGMVYYQQEDLTNALSYIEKSIELKPNYELARFTLGEIYESQGRLQEAVTQFEYILQKIAPNNLKAQAKLAEIKAKMVK